MHLRRENQTEASSDIRFRPVKTRGEAQPQMKSQANPSLERMPTKSGGHRSALSR